MTPGEVELLPHRGGRGSRFAWARTIGRTGHLPAAPLARLRRQTDRGAACPRGARPRSESSRSGPSSWTSWCVCDCPRAGRRSSSRGPSSSALHCGDKVPGVPKLVDTTIRLLGQDPLAGTMGTAELLRLAEILDRAGFAYLEVSGGGVFDSAVRRGVESPWERIRAIQARVKTPLGLALRGRFLVGSRPVDGEFARRFVASAAENGIDVFRLHDPLNDVSNLREAAEAIAAAEREFEAGLVYSPGVAGEVDTLVEQARKLPELGAARVVVHDPTGSLGPHGAAELVAADRRGERPARRRLLPGRRRQRDVCGARGDARRRRPRGVRDLSRRARRVPRLRRVARGGAQGPRPRHRRRRRSPLGGVGDRRPAHRRRAGHAARAASRRARRRVPPARRARRRGSTRACARRPPATGSTKSWRSSRGSAARSGRRRSRRRSARSSARRRSSTCSRRSATSRSSTSCASSSRARTARRPARSTRACDGRWSSSTVTTWLRTSRSRSRTCASRRKASPRARRSSSSSGSSATTPRRCCRGFARAPAATTRSPAGSTGRARNGSARSSASSRSPASAR